MPQLGETVVEGKILTWFKAVGEDVKVGDKLFEVETDKVTVDVEATSEGTLREICVAQGHSVKVGAVVAVLRGHTTKALNPAPTRRDNGQSRLDPFEEVATPPGQFGHAKLPSGVALSPLARRSLTKRGGNVDAIVAFARSRNLRRICEKDVEVALAAFSNKAAATLPRSATITQAVSGVPLMGMRQKIADRIIENWRSIPHVFQGIEVDFTSVADVRLRHKERFLRQHQVSLTFLPFIARAACLALAEFPNINAVFDGRALYPSAQINLGIAVDLSHQGLVVPVIRDAGNLTVDGLAKAISRAVIKARSNRLTVDDLSGGTYTITNNGAFGTTFTSPIINAPEVAILSTDAIRKRPTVVEMPQGDLVGVRLTGFIGQSFDHRAFDGAYSADFLSRLKSIIETRSWSDDLAG